jgi:CRP/FNR family transcriptional regulator, cyclic AMP receptor protein
MSSPSPELLKRVPLFADVEPKDLARIANSFKNRTFKAGAEVATEGASGVGFFVIEDGEATVTVDGREVGKLKGGDYFGELALIDERATRTATLTADTELRTYGLTAWEFRPIVETNAAIAWQLLKALARKLREAEARASSA